MKAVQSATYALLAMSILVTSCSGHKGNKSSLSSQRSYLEKVWAVQVPVVQCLIDNDLIPRRDLREQVWLQNNKVASGTDFDIWYSNHELNKYGKKTLEDSVRDAAEIGPNHDCDTLLNAPPAS